MKPYLKPLLTGLIVTLTMALVMLKITMDFQILLFFGAAIFFLSGLINSRNQNHYVVTTLCIVSIYLAFFILIILGELPELWYFVPIYIASTLLGLLFKRHRLAMGILSVVLLCIALFVSFKIIPSDLENSLTKQRLDKLPEFSIQEINGQLTNSKSLKGKVVVLDFFGTWCKPCIQELKELDKVKAAFSENDVVCYIINADQGGDTPKKFKDFIARNQYTFKFAYDHDSKIFKQLKMNHLGLPTLLIIDKDQNIRLQHVGYNTAETNFREHLVEIIEGLLDDHISK